MADRSRALPSRWWDGYRISARLYNNLMNHQIYTADELRQLGFSHIAGIGPAQREQLWRILDGTTKRTERGV